MTTDANMYAPLTDAQKQLNAVLWNDIHTEAYMISDDWDTNEELQDYIFSLITPQRYRCDAFWW